MGHHGGRGTKAAAIVHRVLRSTNMVDVFFVTNVLIPP